MPVCRHCGSRITKFDKDRCPVCGEINPLDGVSSDTVEVTSQIDIDSSEFQDYKPKTRKMFLIISSLIGWTGAQFFYLRYRRAGLIWLAINLLLLGGGFAAFFFGVHNLLLAILIPTLVIYLANIALGLFIFFKPTFKDANENYLR